MAPTYDVSVEFRKRHARLPPLRLGFLPRSAINTSNGRTAAEALNAVARSGLTEKRYMQNGIRYNMTERAFSYYFAKATTSETILTICHTSAIHGSYRIELFPVKQVTINQRKECADAVRVAFNWQPSEHDAWAKDPVIQSHSVVLALIRSPAVIILASQHAE
jgi:hypothetical protein